MAYVRVMSSKAFSPSTGAPAFLSASFTTLSERLRLTPACCTEEPGMVDEGEDAVEEEEERASEQASRMQSRHNSLQVRSSKPVEDNTQYKKANYICGKKETKK